MRSRSRNDNSGSVSFMFTLLLFLVFIMCALFTVLIGGKVYENITDRVQASYEGQVVLNYVSHKIHQGDVDGGVSVKEIDGVSVLELKQNIYGRDYVTWIYTEDGALRELFAAADAGLGIADGLEIIECPEITFSQVDERRVKAVMNGSHPQEMVIYVRSGGVN